MVRLYYLPDRDRLRLLYPCGKVEYYTDFFHVGKKKYNAKWKRSCYSKSYKTALKSMRLYDKFCGFKSAELIGIIK